MRGFSGYGRGGAVSKAAVALVLLCTTAQAETLEVVALGDSLTQGYGLARPEGLVPQLQDWLTERGHDVEIVNAGVSGDTTQGGLSRVEWSLSEETDALIVALGGNDLLRGIDPAVSRANLDGILEVAAARELPVLLVGLEAPSNYGPEYRDAFNAIYPELAQEYGTLLVPDFFAGLDAEGAGGAAFAAQRYMQGDGIHPNAEGVVRIVETLGPEVEALLDRAEGEPES